MLSLLIVEDQESDISLIEQVLRSAGLDFRLTCADREDAYRRALAENPDLIISDCRLPVFTGEEALRIRNEVSPDTPFIIVTGSLDDAGAAGVMGMGANDYLLKDRLARLPASIRTALAEKKARAETGAAADRLAETEALYRGILDTASDMIYLRDGAGRLFYANRAFREALGSMAAGMEGLNIYDIVVPESLQKAGPALEAMLKGEPGADRVELVCRNADGRVMTVEGSVRPYKRAGQEPLIQGVFRDVTAEREREAHILLSLKMDSLAAFASAVAHDFNNILGAIEGYTAIILPSLEEGTLKEDISEIRRAGQRGADITGMLSLFSRKQKLNRTGADLGAIAAGVAAMAAKRAGDGITVRYERPVAPLPAICDRDKMEQALMSLTVNAIEAMPGGGEVELSVSAAHYDRSVSPPEAELTKGSACARLIIRDSGIGMTPEVLERATEPLFTTKTRSKGAGMGLSCAYAIIRQNGGDMEITSRAGAGTTVTVWLPPAEHLPDEAVAGMDESADRPRILLLEDDQRLNKVVAKGLTVSGFRVDPAATLGEAVALFREKGGAYDLLFMDVMLPDGRSYKMVDRFLKINPAIKIVLATGFLEKSDIAEEAEKTGYPLIEKPYDIAKTAELFRKMTAERRGGAGG